ncbi:MAG: hypothetical protein U1F43_06065 [Myxococcota bacterium]
MMSLAGLGACDGDAREGSVAVVEPPPPQAPGTVHVRVLRDVTSNVGLTCVTLALTDGGGAPLLVRGSASAYWQSPEQAQGDGALCSTPRQRGVVADFIMPCNAAAPRHTLAVWAQPTLTTGPADSGVYSSFDHATCAQPGADGRCEASFTCDADGQAEATITLSDDLGRPDSMLVLSAGDFAWGPLPAGFVDVCYDVRAVIEPELGPNLTLGDPRLVVPLAAELPRGALCASSLWGSDDTWITWALPCLAGEPLTVTLWPRVVMRTADSKLYSIPVACPATTSDSDDPLAWDGGCARTVTCETWASDVDFAVDVFDDHDGSVLAAPAPR